MKTWNDFYKSINYFLWKNIEYQQTKNTNFYRKIIEYKYHIKHKIIRKTSKEIKYNKMSRKVKYQCKKRYILQNLKCIVKLWQYMFSVKNMYNILKALSNI